MPRPQNIIPSIRFDPRTVLTACCLVVLPWLAGCGTQPIARVDNHLNALRSPVPVEPEKNIPPPLSQVALPPPPIPRADELRYSISGIDLPAREVLLAISRETKVNIDIFPGIEGRVTINAIDQTLRQILTRMSRQVDMRWEVHGPNISVMPDSPYLKIYRIDYVNIARDTESSFGVQTQVVAPAGAAVAGGGTAGGAGSNTSQVSIKNSGKNRFWESLEKNIKDILRDTDKQLPEGSSETVTRAQTASATTSARTQSGGSSARSQANRTTTGPGETQGNDELTSQTLTFREAASVIVNTETGTVSVRATSRQQEKVSEFIEQVIGVARRQVLIEATIVEVTLNDNYQAGVDWSALGLKDLGYSFRQSFTGAALANSPFFSIRYNNPTAAVGGSVSSTVRLLSAFGSTKVLSSPRTVAMNNQTAILKVVENRIYFTISAQISPATVNAGATVAFTSTPNVVPEGFVMSVTPQIGENDMVTLNVRPSITRITGFVNDPNPSLALAGVISRVPEIQTREIETMMRVPSGMTAVMGGLMQDSFVANRDGLPVLSRVPIVGDAVSYRNDTGRKTELVVFLRPIVIKDASMETDLSDYRRYLPDRSFFKDAEPARLPFTGAPSADPPAKGPIPSP